MAHSKPSNIIMASNTQFTAFECTRCKAFSTDESRSIGEQHQQMRQHLDVAHPYWDLENIGADSQAYEASFRPKVPQRSEYYCSACQTTLPSYTTFCPRCRKPITEFFDRTQLGSLNKSTQRRQLFGIVGSILLFIGVFTPIISLPFVGSMNYFQNGKGDGVIVLVLAIISIALTLSKRYGGLWVTGVGSLLVMLFTFVNFQIRMSEIQNDMDTKLAGNPFRGIADVAMQSVQIQWGWAVLVVGAAFLIAAAAIRYKR